MDDQLSEKEKETIQWLGANVAKPLFIFAGALAVIKAVLALVAYNTEDMLSLSELLSFWALSMAIILALIDFHSVEVINLYKLRLKLRHYIDLLVLGLSFASLFTAGVSAPVICYYLCG